jgi:dolichol-phosphate mannosyltransferase
MLISIISPVYKSENSIKLLIETIIQELEIINVDFEIVLVDDNSPDQSWDIISNLCLKDTRIKGIKLSKNFGQHIAITAGVKNSTGDYIVVMDCDLQDSPKYIFNMLDECNKGYEIVYTIKENRNHNWFKNFTAIIFNLVFNFLSDNIKSNDKIGSFSMISRRVANEYLKFNDCKRHYIMLIRKLGFKSTAIKVVHNKRLKGQSSYNFIKLITHAIDGITFNSTKLLKLSIIFGLQLSVFSISWGLWVFYMYLFHSVSSGYTSIMLLLTLSTGLILSSIGITGLYIGNTFEQVKNNPLYIIEKKIN